MARLAIFFLVALCLIGICRAQLVTAFQICEMQQMKIEGVESGVSVTSETMQKIRDYCMKHAYDNIGNMGTLG